MDPNNTIGVITLYAINLALFFLSANVLLCIVNYKKMKTPLKRLFYFLILNLITEISAIVFSELGFNNLPLLHLYTLGEFILFSYFFRSLIQKPVFFQKNYWYLILVGSLLIIANSLCYQSIFEFNSLAKTFVQIIIIGYAVLYFYNLVENQPFSIEMAKSLRLINSAIIIYYSGSLFIFMCSQVSFIETEAYVYFWAFNGMLNVIFQLLILWGLWRIFYKETILSS